MAGFTRIGARRPWAIIALLAGACAPASPGTDQSDVVGGTATGGFPAVGRLGPSRCTGTLIHPQAILTAAHCVDEGANGFAFTGVGGELWVPFERVVAHPGYGESHHKRVWDVAVGILAHPVIEIEPRALMDERDVEVGEEIQLVGFGWTDFDGTRPEGKHAGIADIDRLEYWWVVLERGEGDAQTCPGDSGSPYLDPDTGEIVAVHARGECQLGGEDSRGAPAWHHADWIAARVAEGVRPELSPALHPLIFDAELYGLMHPELAPEALEAHWLEEGLPSGGRGSATFDPAFYVAHHGLGLSFEEAAGHYLEAGLPQGWTGAEEFDPVYLMTQIDEWPFAQAALSTAAEHYLARDLEYRASASYDPVHYMSTYDDWQSLGLTFRAALAHYLTVGKPAGRPGAAAD